MTEDDPVDDDPLTDGLLTIGAFAARARLSAKALRLYDRLGLLAPARVDEATGYRYYRADQVERARLVALLRQLDMPLARIAEVLGAEAAGRLAGYWADVESRVAGQRTLAEYLRGRLSGRSSEMYEKFVIETVDVPAQVVITESRHTLADELPTWIGASFGRLEEAAREWAAARGRTWKTTVRAEPAARLAYTRITKAQVANPQILAAFEAVEQWMAGQGLEMAGPCREIYFADWDAAGPTDLVCDVAFPVR
ncbi:MerR family transcriptional regulator [Streptomyces sp. NPDC049099]|uniref:MerR family transcriptional regulator n=1 Tax=Streptomyces sp. NPDC049099 TaxID=3155768 RepID=UPI00342BA409